MLRLLTLGSTRLRMIRLGLWCLNVLRVSILLVVLMMFRLVWERQCCSILWAAGLLLMIKMAPFGTCFVPSLMSMAYYLASRRRPIVRV